MLTGSLLFLVFAGEVTVAATTGLFTPQGFLVLAAMYLSYFYLYDALVRRYELSVRGGVLVSFALYAVLVTGLLHSELADYVLHPEHTLFITLIRVQASVYPIFAYQLLAHLVPPAPTGRTVSVVRPIAALALLALVLSPTHQFGLWNIGHTIDVAPAYSAVFIVIGGVAFLMGIRMRTIQRSTNKSPIPLWTWALFAIACIPHPAAYAVLVFGMIGIGIQYAVQKQGQPLHST